MGRVAFLGVSRRVRWLRTSAFGVLAAMAVFVHTWKGLYDVHPFLWCQDGTYVGHLFDWRHPQALATAASLAEHRREHLLPTLPVRALREPLTPTSGDVIFEGWSRPESGGSWRWTDGRSAAILFRINPRELDERPAPRLVLEIIAGTYRAQQVSVSVNGVEVGTITSTSHWQPAVNTIALSPSVLERDVSGQGGTRAVEIGLGIPGARSPASEDPEGRVTGVSSDSVSGI